MLVRYSTSLLATFHYFLVFNMSLLRVFAFKSSALWMIVSVMALGVAPLVAVGQSSVEVPSADARSVVRRGSPASNTQPVQLVRPSVEVIDPTRATATRSPSAPSAPSTLSAPSGGRMMGVPKVEALTGVGPSRRGVKDPLEPNAADPVPSVDVGMRIGESRLIRGLRSTRVVVGTDKVVTAVVLENREVMLFGNAQGATTVQVWDAANVMRTFQVRVDGADIAKMADEVRSLLSDLPGIKVSVVGEKVVVDGRGVGDEGLFRIAALTKRFENVVNLTEYQKDHGGWDQMVILDVKVVEFRNRDRLRSLGVDWNTSNVNGPAFGIAGDIKTSRTSDGQRVFVAVDQDGAASVASTTAARLVPFRSFFGLASALTSKINLVASDGDAVILSEPQLTARNGRSARMNVGGRIPFSVTTGLGTAEVRYERYGVSLEVTPYVTAGGMVQAKIKADVSEPSDLIENRISFTERMVETVFNVQDGQTMVLSGLIQRAKQTGVNKIPGVGDIPVVGHAFKNTRTIDKDTELVIFVTPKIIEATHPGVQAAIEAAERRIDEALGPRPSVERDKP